MFNLPYSYSSCEQSISICFQSINYDSDYLKYFLRTDHKRYPYFSSFFKSMLNKLDSIVYSATHYFKRISLDFEYLEILSDFFPNLIMNKKSVLFNYNIKSTSSIPVNFFWYYRWIAIFLYSRSNVMEFKAEEFIVDYISKWYPFIHGFFLIKTTKSNQFFLFGLYYNMLRMPTFLRYAALKAFVKSKGRLDVNLLYETSDLYDYKKFRIDYFKSAGSFGYIKRNKTSYHIIEEVLEMISDTFIDYVTKYKIDFFFIYIKGSFKHIKILYSHFTKIIKDSFTEYRSKMWGYLKLKNVFYRRIYYRRRYKKLSNSDYVSKIQFAIERASYFWERLINRIQASENSYLVYHIESLDAYSIDVNDIHKYLNNQYIVVSRSIKEYPSSIYLKKIPFRIKTFFKKFKKIRNFLKWCTYRVKKRLKKTIFRQDNSSTNAKDQNDSNSFNVKIKSGSRPSKTIQGSNTNESSIRNNYNYKSQASVLVKLINEVTSTSFELKSRHLKDSTSSVKDLIGQLTTTTTTTMPSNTVAPAKNKIRAFVVFKKHTSTGLIKNMWRLFDWYRGFKKNYRYKYVFSKRPIPKRSVIRCLFKAFKIPYMTLVLYTRIVKLNSELRDFFLTLPRSFTIVDITSYAFNGCRRTRHYHKYATI